MIVNDFFDGIDKREDSIILYHITLKSNIESILSSGLIPKKGPNRRRCKYAKDRESSEVWISFCKRSEISSWINALYPKINAEDIVVLEVVVPKHIKIRHWLTGYEVGYFNGSIGPEFIKIYNGEI